MLKLKIFSSKTPKRESNATTTVTSSEGGCKKSNPFFEQLERLQQRSPLWRMSPLKTIALFERDEVHTSSSDKGVAIGTFYHTFAVTRVCLKERHGGSSVSDDGSGPFTAIDGMLEDSNKDHDTDKDKQHAARQQLAASTMEIDGGNDYCIKHIPKKIHKKLQQGRDKGRYLQAVTNLLVEANYLSKCDHPHILQLHGQADSCWAVEDPKQKQYDAFFVITDRISETLEDRLEGWRAEQAKDPTRHPVDPKCPLFQKKLGYVRDIASALKYLHERQIMVLGLNPTGIGFLAHSGRLQLCDLGTCREMSTLDLSHGNNNQLEDSHVSPESEGDIRFEDDEIGDGERFSNSGDCTGASHSSGDMSRDASFIVPFVEAGTIPRYMAPEVVMQGAAGASLRADSYSVSMITVETLTLQKAYCSFKAGQFLVKVCMEGKRPNLSMYPQLPSPVEGILRRAWRHTVEKRWSCAEICEGFELIIEKLQGDDGSKMPSSGATKMSSRTLVLPDKPSPRRRSNSLEDASTIDQSVGSRENSSYVAPRKGTNRQQQRQKRGTDSMSKSMSMRDFSSRNSMGGRRHNSASNLFALAAAVPQGQRSDVKDVLVLEPGEAISPTKDASTIEPVVPSRDSISNVAPLKGTHRQQQREKRGKDSMSKSMSMRHFSSRKSMGGRRHNSASNLFALAAAAVPQGQCSDVNDALVIRPEEGDQNDGSALVAVPPRKAKPPRRNRSQEKEEQIETHKISNTEPQPDERSQESQQKEDPTLEEPDPKGERRKSTSSDALPNASDETKKEAIVLGDGTTIAIKTQLSKRSSNKMKDSSKRDLKAPERSKMMKRSQSGSSRRGISSVADKAVADVRTKSRRVLSMNDTVPKVEKIGAPPRIASSTQRKSSGSRKEHSSTAEHDNLSGDVHCYTKKMPRRKHSTDSLSRQKPPTKQRDTPATEGKEINESRSNKAIHRRSVELQEGQALVTPQLQRRVSAPSV
jgi:serine/threonine protein kinase